MADDTVDDARQRLEFVLSDLQDDMAELPPVKFAIDKLIAAVRAENTALVDYAQHKSDCAIYRGEAAHGKCTCGLDALSAGGNALTDAVVDAAPRADFPEVTLRSLMREWLEEAARHPRYSALAKLLKRQAAAAKAGADALDAKNPS